MIWRNLDRRIHLRDTLRSIMRPVLITAALSTALLLFTACHSKKLIAVEDPEVDTGTDADTDSDVDADGDTDSDTDTFQEEDAYLCPIAQDAGLGIPEVCEMFTSPAHPWQEGCCMWNGSLLVIDDYDSTPDGGVTCNVTNQQCPTQYHCCFEGTQGIHDCCPDQL